MAERLTKSAARNVFYGGSAFFFAIFLGLTAHSHYYMVTTSTDGATLTASVARGKHVWEKNSCINCHTLLGEGAYFAPEVGNVWDRWGGKEDPAAAQGHSEGLDAGPAVRARRAGGKCRSSTSPTRNSTISPTSWNGPATSRRQNWPPNKAG